MKRVLIVFAVLLGVFAFMTGAFAEGDDAAVDELTAVTGEVAGDDATADDATADDATADDATADDATADDATADNATADDATADDGATDATPPAPLGVSVVVDGELVDFSVYGVEPLITEVGRTIVPLRAVFEVMGAEVDWDNETRTVTAVKGDIVVVLAIDSTTPTINGVEVEIDQPAIIMNDRTMAPLRFVAEAFGGVVDWNNELKTAFITLPKEAVEEPAVEEEATDEEATDEEATDVEAADEDAVAGEDEAADSETGDDGETDEEGETDPA